MNLLHTNQTNLKQRVRNAGHGWMMLGCVAMLVIAIVLVATGVAAVGFIFAAVMCAAMMAMMMNMMICRRCNTMVDVDCALGHAPCLEPSFTSGYAIDEAEINYWGLCPACRTDS